MHEALSYDDVLLVPQYSTVASREDVYIGNRLNADIELRLPIISSPMDTVTEEKMATAICLQGGLGIIHRYNLIEEQAAMVNNVLKHTGLTGQVGAAVGANGDYLQRAVALTDAGALVLCIDIAHGHHILMERAIKSIRDKLSDNIHIMAGCIATLEGFNALANWGADSIRCGIGGGSICSTRLQTGHGMPGLETIMECAQSEFSTKIIADGGIKNSGDIVKALAAGADFVMVGSLLAGTAETPGPIVDNSKKYRGMASRDAQMSWRGKSFAPEGVSTAVSYKGSVADVLEDVRGNIASGFSYSGARNIEELWDKSEFIIQTSAGQIESSTHIMSRQK